jgi:diguanylate cyclase (GGDEF)-like protein
MRGDTDTSPRRDTGLSPAARRSLAASLILFIAVVFTGAASSRLLLPLAAALAFTIRYVPARAAVAAPFAAAGLLAGLTLLRGGIDLRTSILLLLFLGACAPGWVWRREHQRTVKRLAQLDDILAQAATQRTLKEAAPAAAEQIADLERALASVAARIHARSVIVWDVDADHGTARARAGSHGRPGITVRLAGDPVGWAWEQGMRLRLDKPPAWAEQDSILFAERLRRHEDFGLLITYAFDPAQVPPDDTAFDESAIYLRGLISLHDARAAAAGSERRVSALLSSLHVRPEELDPHVYISRLCATAMTMTDATGAVIGVWDGEEGRVITTVGEDGGPREGQKFRAPETELGLAARAGTMLVRDASSWSLGRTSVAGSEERWSARPRALAALPLRNAAGTIGVMGVWTSEARALEMEGLRLLHLLTPHVAMHLEHAFEFERMRQTAERDPLTHLRNRRAFDEVFAQETTRYERYGHPMSLLMLDLDHFKSINDRFGHEAGDEVLRQVARVLPAHIRDVDVAARFGGEEFVVLLPETAPVAALEVAERIRVGVGALAIDWRGTRIPVTVSIGVASVPERGKDPAGLMGAADAALYRAKANGRNRVEQA